MIRPFHVYLLDVPKVGAEINPKRRIGAVYQDLV